VRAKMTSDISTPLAVAPVPLDFSTAVSGLSQDSTSGDIRGTVTERTAGRHCGGGRRAPNYGYELLQGVGNHFGRSLRPCPNGLTNRGRVET
jgi:hypothetical protein